MIKIVSDLANLGSEDTEIHVSQVIEYPKLVESILNAQQHNRDLTAVVHSSIVIQWLNTMSLRYPQGTFVFETLDARTVLSSKWGVALPDDLHNEDIQENHLLDLDLQPQAGQGFEDLVLSHFYGPLFGGKSFPFTQLPQLLASVDKKRWQANRSHSLLVRIYNQRLEAWKNNTRSAELRQCIDWFITDPVELQKKLMAFRVLHFYPTIGESLLGDAYPILIVLKLQLHDLEVDEKAIPTVITRVTYSLNAHKPQSSDDIVELIKRVSGLLSIEFDILEKHLKEHPEWILAPLVDLLETKFESFSRKKKKNLAALRAQIHPAKPQAPDLGWGVEQMLDWATNQYLPYQAWCSAQEKFDSELFRIGDQFSEWLIKNWEDIRANSGRMVFNILPKIAPELKDPRRIHLMLVVDNLGWSFAEMLRDLFQEKGFYLVRSEPYLAMLPSETEISKKCLLSGSVGYTDINDRSYTDILEKGWVPFLSEENAFHYISNIGSLSRVEALDSRAYVVNYLAVDETLHESKDKIGMPHSKHIRHLLTELIENVVNFIEGHDIGERTCIHVVSDHGSTQIPANTQNDIDVELYKQTGFEAPSHRYLKVSDDRFSKLADNLKIDCFFLSANQYKLPTNVICARRGNRFLPTDKNSFVHGGALPEEVIVPYLTFEPATVSLKDLDILLKKNEFRYRLESVELEIGNPNDAAVEQVQVSCLNGNVEWEFQPIAMLNGHHHETCQLQARFKRTSLPEETNQLGLRVRYRCRGETRSFDVNLPIRMIKMVEEKSSGVFDE